MAENFDIVIIGSGAGGGTLAYALRDSGRRVLLLERGDTLPAEPANWDVQQVFFGARYKNAEEWIDAGTGRTFKPGVHYYVGGNTKVYGAALPRFRREDFQALEHEGGTSLAWPIQYADLEPYYAQAEQLYNVHGQPGEDPTEPPRSGPFPFPAVPHEPHIAALAAALQKQGLHPSHLPMGVDLRAGGRCVRCATCDGFPCQMLAKSDVDVCAVRPALAGGVTLWTRAFVRRLLTDAGGRRVTTLEVERAGTRVEVTADVVVVAGGAVNSAALLLRSAGGRHARGLANSSGQVGRNYMVHNNTALMAVGAGRHGLSFFQKTLFINDFYLRGPNWKYPLGNLQMLGKLQAGMLAAAQPWAPGPVLRAMAERSADWWVMSEDLPDPANYIELDSSGTIRVHWRPNNRESHRRLVSAAVAMMRAAGYPLVFTQTMGIETNSHQCGTARMGLDPATSVLDPFCKAHDLDNLYVVDSSFFPSSAAMNPALTIAAQALRVADHLMGRPLRTAAPAASEA